MGYILKCTMQNTSYLHWVLENVAKQYICFCKSLPILVVLFYEDQKQFARNACADKLAFSVDYLLCERFISYGITHRGRVLFLLVEYNM